MPSNRGSDSLYRYILMLHTYVKDTPNQDTLWVGDLGKPHKLDSKHKNSRPKPRCTPDPNSDLYPKPLSLSMHVCLNLCLYPSLSLSPYLCLPIYVYIYLFIYIYIYVYLYIYIYIYIYLTLTLNCSILQLEAPYGNPRTLMQSMGPSSKCEETITKRTKCEIHAVLKSARKSLPDLGPGGAEVIGHPKP